MKKLFLEKQSYINSSLVNQIANKVKEKLILDCKSQVLNLEERKIIKRKVLANKRIALDENSSRKCKFNSRQLRLAFF